MNTYRALSLAAAHARTCNGLECDTPPPVSAGYLEAAVARCALPIRVWCDDEGLIHGQRLKRTYGLCGFTAAPDVARSVYLRLCATFDSLSAASPADGVVPPNDNATPATEPLIPGSVASLSATCPASQGAEPAGTSVPASLSGTRP